MKPWMLLLALVLLALAHLAPVEGAAAKKKTVEKAKITVKLKSAGLIEKEIEASSWACAEYKPTSPWEAHDEITKYRGGQNVKKLDMMNVMSYPLILKTKVGENRLCIFISQKSHCYPPKPTLKSMSNVDTKKITYYSIDFWGQASTVRVNFYKQKLLKKLTDGGKKDKADVTGFYLSFFPDHMKEVRFNKK